MLYFYYFYLLIIDCRLLELAFEVKYELLVLDVLLDGWTAADIPIEANPTFFTLVGTVEVAWVADHALLMSQAGLDHMRVALSASNRKFSKKLD